MGHSGPLSTGPMGTAFVSPCEQPPLGRKNRHNSIYSITASSSLSSSTFSFEGDTFFRGGDQSTQLLQQQRVPRSDEPNLFDIPADLSPTYRPVPMLIQIAIIVASASLVGRRGLSQLLASTLSRSAILQRLMSPLAERLPSFSVVRRALWFCLRTALVSTLAKLGIQEAFYAPSSGVTTQYLADRDELPSTLSRYRVVTPLSVSAPARIDESNERATISNPSWSEDDSSAIALIGVHSIQYTQQTANEGGGKKKHKYDGMYLHHGFGAMSLSWLPVLPTLVDRLGSGDARGVAHDAPGFGLTDRPDADADADGGLFQYGFENNVGIGLALMRDALSEQVALPVEDDATTNSNEGTRETKSVAIFGHSMGSKSALLAALHYASHPELQVKPNLVVLVAPALEGATLPSRRAYALKATGQGIKKESKGRMRRMARKIYIAWKRIFVDIPLQYGTRRLVCGTKDFWRNGLSLAWGDPNILSDSDILRFKWPSVIKGWEGGIINFARARILSSPSRDTLDDGQLLKRVADLRDTKVVIIYGSKDRVVRIEGAVAASLKKDFPSVKLIRLEGAGHDPFEENVGGFVMELEKALE